MQKNIMFTRAVITVLLILPLLGLPIPMFNNSLVITAVAQESSTTVNITTVNETVYITISGLSVYNFSRSQVTIGWYNSTHIYATYTGLFIYNATKELVPVVVKIYDYNEDTGSKTLRYVFDATDFSAMTIIENTLLVKTEHYNVSNFTGIYYTVYNMTSPSNPIILYEGSMPPPPVSTVMTSYEANFMGYIATLLPVSLLVMFAGRGETRLVGVGLILYGIIMLVLPYVGIYPPYSSYIFPIAMILGAIILFFSR